jgi:MFS family permease
MAALMKRDKEARRFFFAYAQSSLGTGAAYVALLLIAYSRFHSPWALSLVLLADFVPPMLLAPIFGAAADRWSRKRCAVTADVLRAGAFAGIALTSSFPLTVVLALVAGVGTALYKPSILAGLPEIVGTERLAQATALYGALTEIGFTGGPGIAAAFLLFGGPKALLVANAVTFAISGLTLATLSFRHAARRPQEATARSSLFREARDGLRFVAGVRAARTVIVASSTIMLFAGMVNVAELLLAKHLGGGRAGYSLFVAVGGVGIALGSLTGASSKDLRGVVRRYLAGLVLGGAGLIGTAAAPSFASALVPLLALGFGNGMLIVFERQIIQFSVPGPLHGRAFGAQVSLDGFAFGASFLCGGALLAVTSPRVLFLIGGVGALLVWAVARQLFAGIKAPEEQLPAAETQLSPAAGREVAGAPISR